MGSANGVLQAATTIAKTTQTAVGAEIGCHGYSVLTLFFSYTKGDETGLDIMMNGRRTTGGTDYAESLWTPTTAVYAPVAIKHRLTATTVTFITYDVSGLDFVTITQGGSNNDGTPTGTLAASYTLKGEVA